MDARLDPAKYAGCLKGSSVSHKLLGGPFFMDLKI
jgi:hypothetical protein